MASSLLALTLIMGLVHVLAGGATGESTLRLLLPLLPAILFALVGSALVVRYPGNAAAGVLLAAGFFSALNVSTYAYAAYGLLSGRRSVPGAELAAWISSWSWLPSLVLTATLLLLLFPDGRLPSRRWRWFLWLTLGALCLLLLALAFAPRTPLAQFPAKNPLAIEAAGGFLSLMALLSALILALCAVASLASFVIRFHRAEGRERPRFRWLTYAGVLFLITSASQFAPQATPEALFVGILAIPLGAGFGMLNSPVHDPHRVLTRPLIYGCGAALLGAYLAASFFSPRPPTSPVRARGPATAAGDCSGVTIRPGDDLQRMIDVHPSGTSFCFARGLYRLQHALIPKSNQRFIAQPGTLLDGSQRLLGFRPRSRYWVAEGGVPENPHLHGECEPRDYAGCQYNDVVFLDNHPLRRVTSLDQLGAGRVFIDTATHDVYLSERPRGRIVEQALAANAFRGAARLVVGASYSKLKPSDNVTVRGFVVQKFANGSQQGAIDAYGGTGWQIDANEVRLNHAAGIAVGDDGEVRRNYVHHNGQTGITSHAASDLIVDNNEISYNNTARFFWGGEAGGVKLVDTARTVVRRNHSHDNHGIGLWTDWNCIDILYESNLVNDNAAAGIFHEVSYDAVIHDNRIENNGFGYPLAVHGAGIVLRGSPNVHIYRNSLSGNAADITMLQLPSGETGRYGPRELANLRVHGNEVAMSRGMPDLLRWVIARLREVPARLSARELPELG